jgi:hypothetical protein
VTPPNTTALPELVAGLRDVIRWIIAKDPLATNFIYVQQAIEHLDRLASPAMGEVERLREFIANPPKHRFWGAGEPDCPREIKAGNGELHTLRCKTCGEDNPRDEICRAGVTSTPDTARLREAVIRVRDGYASQTKFSDPEPASYFREVVRRLDAALLAEMEQ